MKRAAIRREITAPYVVLDGLKKWLLNNELPDEPRIRCSELADKSFLIDVEISPQHLQIEHGGMPKLASILFGNQFRHEAIRSVQLNDIELSGDGPPIFAGPRFGVAGLTEEILSSELPAISVPLPYRLSAPDREGLVSLLSRSGVQIMTDSPLAHQTGGELESSLAFLERLRSESRKRFIYFLNGTVSLAALLPMLGIIQEARCENPGIGVRLCPQSAGFSVCEHIRSREIPIYGYNLFNLPIVQKEGFGLRPKAASRIMRLIGCDLINVGLKTNAILGSAAADEIVEAVTDSMGAGLRPALPVFTGSITPRRACEILGQFGTDVVLHIKKPILRAGTDVAKLRRNIAAFRQAIDLAKNGEDVVALLAREAGKVRFIREYEADYGEAQEL